MATIPVINSQGTMVYVADVPLIPWADCTEAVAGIQSGSLVGCPQSLGDLAETRAMTEYKCLSSNDSAKALGAISRGSFDIGLLLDPEDTEGQEDLRSAFQTNTAVIIGIELPNADIALGEVGASGTVYWFEAKVSGVSASIALDAAITYTVTVEISSAITECPMVPGAAS